MVENGSCYIVSLMSPRHAYTKLGITLFAVEIQHDDRKEVLLNPGSDVIISQSTVGLIMCHSVNEAQRLQSRDILYHCK